MKKKYIFLLSILIIILMTSPYTIIQSENYIKFAYTIQGFLFFSSSVYSLIIWKNNFHRKENILLSICMFILSLSYIGYGWMTTYEVLNKATTSLDWLVSILILINFITNLNDIKKIKNEGKK